MNDFEKATKLLSKANLSEVSRETEITRAMLTVYRNDPEKLKVAKWCNVHKLAEYYDSVIAAKLYRDISYRKKSQGFLYEFFDESYNAYSDDPDYQKMIKRLRDIVRDDPSIYVEITKHLKK